MVAIKLNAIKHILFSSQFALATSRKGHAQGVTSGKKTTDLADLIAIEVLLKRMAQSVIEDINEQATEVGELRTAEELRKAMDKL